MKNIQDVLTGSLLQEAKLTRGEKWNVNGVTGQISEPNPVDYTQTIIANNDAKFICINFYNNIIAFYNDNDIIELSHFDNGLDSKLSKLKEYEVYQNEGAIYIRTNVK